MEGPSVIGQAAWFLILTLIYGYIDYSARIEGTPDGNKLLVYKSVYLLAAVIGQYFVTVGASAAVCGVPQYYTSLFATAFPWTFIFGSIVGLLSVFPGWVLPFSNTIGYAIANAMGMGKLANEVFTKPSKDSGLSPDMAKAISFVYTDKASLLNNITPGNFESFWKASGSGGPNSIRQEVSDGVKKKFKDFVILKHQLGTLTWYLLTGLLVVSISYNYVVNSPCASSVSQIAESAEKNVEKRIQEQNTSMVYTMSE